VSIPFAWLIGGLVQGVSVPLLGVARRADRAEPVEPAAAAPEGEPGLEAESPGCFGPEPSSTRAPRGQVAASCADERVA
jgi:hypothetical protein